jgi:hypothetical protein
MSLANNLADKISMGTSYVGQRFNEVVGPVVIKAANGVYSAYAFVHDYSILACLKALHKCETVGKNHEPCCRYSKHIIRKERVPMLCRHGVPDLGVTVEKYFHDNPIYSYCGCKKQKQADFLESR